VADRSAFDLFAGLAALGRRDIHWYDGLTPEGQKAAAPFVMARWLTGTSDKSQIIRLNTVVNPYLFAGSADKSALFKLLATACTGKNVRYSWLKGPSSKVKKLTSQVVCEYYECSARESAGYSIDADSLIEMAEELGWDKEQVAKLKKELEDGPGSTAKASTKPTKPRGGKRA
jgi:hypothetical protein